MRTCISCDVVSIQITDKWICVFKRLREFATCVCANTVFLLQEDTIYVLSGSSVPRFVSYLT